MRAFRGLTFCMALAALTSASLAARAQGRAPTSAPEAAHAAAADVKGDQVEAVDLAEFEHVDPKHLVSDVALKRAITYFKKNKSTFGNQNYLAVVDFTLASNVPRLFIVNLKTGVVNAHLTSHGKGSDPENTGRVQEFSNEIDSDESSYGFYRTAEIYSGKHLRSMRLDGLSTSNSNARVRDIVIHAAWYVTEAGHHAGRSDGCFAVDPKKRDGILAKLEGGALLYGWSGKN